MKKYERTLTITVIILFVINIFMFALLENKKQEILKQEDKILNLQLELDNAKEVIDKQHLELINYEVLFNNLTIQDRLEVGKWVI